MAAVQRPPVVGVMGGSRATPEVEGLARELGALIAARGWVLLNGGRDAGVMDASARGAAEAGGLTVGVLPFAHEAEWPISRHIQVAILTGMGDARNAINVLSSHVVVALPGGPGTLSEVALAIKNDRPVVLLGWPGDTPLGALEVPPGAVVRANDAAEAVEQVSRLLGRI